MTEPILDLLVLGAGLRGLTAGLAARRNDPAGQVTIVEREAQPGGSIRTLRSNGFCCELGPFAFAREEVEPVLTLLATPPTLVATLPTAHHGWTFDGTALQPVAVDPTPWSFPTGTEELPQACRRALGPVLRLGRAARVLRPSEDGWDVELDGEVPATLRTRAVILAVPMAAATALLAPFDPALAAAATRLRTEPRAFAFFGGHQGDSPELSGYGIVPTDGVDSPLVEAIFCTQVFANRALPGRMLVRCEVAGAALAGDDEAVLATAEQELRRWTGCRGRWPFTKLRRFDLEVTDGAWVECRARLQGLAARTTGLKTA